MASPPTMKHGDLEQVEPQNHNTKRAGRSESVVTQTGVKRAEVIATTWTKQSLYVAYAGFEYFLQFPLEENSGLTPKEKRAEYFLWRFACHSISRLPVYLCTTQLQPFRHIRYLLRWVLLAAFSMV